MRSCSASLRPMIKRIRIDKIRFALGIAVMFLVSYVLWLNLVIPAFLLALGLYFYLANRKLKTQWNLLYSIFLFVTMFAIGYSVIKQGWSMYYIPFSAVPMLCAILFNDLWLSLLLTMGCGVAIAHVAGNNFYLLTLYLTSGMLSAILVLEARRRMAIIRAGFIIGAVQAVLLFFIDRFFLRDFSRYAILFLNGVSCGVIAIGILPVFEYLFKTVTNISLLELADFNNPLLKRLMMEAPGTYHHSLVVGNLSEAACSVVGAHSLLARIGAYYHDIGKLQKPEYFSENQCVSESKHSSLTPTISKMVIMNHVKDGIEMARRSRLTPRLIDFIQQHHGNSLVYYFYLRAVEKLDDDQEVGEEGFRYPGPKPNSRETAIVLLADSVEAATRALRDPTPAKIEDVVHKIINNKFIDGQLDECDLTLKDLEKISEVFIRILNGIYHSRVVSLTRLPPQSENNHTEPPKKDSPHPENSKGTKTYTAPGLREGRNASLWDVEPFFGR